MMMASKIDEQIRQALKNGNEGGDEIDPFAATTEEGLFRQAMDLFHGQQKFWNVLVMVFSIVFFGVVVYAAVQFFGTAADDSKMQIMWATIFLYAGLAVAMLKMWTWMQMNKNCVTREIKRLELQIAALKAVAEDGERD